MRKLMMTAVAVAGLGLTVGCQKSGNNDVQAARQDVAEAQREAAEKSAEANREALDTRQEAQQEVVEERRELAEVQSERADAEHKSISDDEATGGSGMAANVQKEEVKGTIQSASASSVTLMVPDKNNQMMRFQANPQTQVMKDDKPVALTDLKAGDEVRASYEMDQNGKMVLRSIELKKESAQHPGQQKK